MPLLMCEWVVLFSLFSLLFTLSIFFFPFTTALSFPFFSSSKTPKNPHFLFSNTKLVKVGLTCYWFFFLLFYICHSGLLASVSKIKSFLVFGLIWGSFDFMIALFQIPAFRVSGLVQLLPYFGSSQEFGLVSAQMPFPFLS
jgi:hypothetical protein